MISSALHKSYGKLVHSGIQRIRDGETPSVEASFRTRWWWYNEVEEHGVSSPPPQQHETSLFKVEYLIPHQTACLISPNIITIVGLYLKFTSYCTYTHVMQTKMHFLLSRWLVSNEYETLVSDVYETQVDADDIAGRRVASQTRMSWCYNAFFVSIRLVFGTFIH